MKEYARKTSFLNGFVLGISGGQDSTLVGKLAQLAVDELNDEEETSVINSLQSDCLMVLSLMKRIARMHLDFIKPSLDLYS